jgi:hypothetical protein
MTIQLIYEAIEAKKLFQLFKHEKLDNREILHFKRHNSTFRFLKKMSPDSETEYVLLKDNEKARFGTLREIWNDFLEIKQE